MEEKLLEALKGKPRIKLLACDVDGVLTDGGMYFNAEGQAFKCFNVKDGLGITLLRESGVKIAFISADNSEISRQRGEKLRVHYICLGVTDKAQALREIMAQEGLSGEEIVYVGDDLPDLCVVPLVGLFVAPSDAVDEIKAQSAYVTSASGGHGAIRVVCDAIRAHNERLENNFQKSKESSAGGGPDCG